MSKSNPSAVPNNADDNAAYSVGYGKPPTHTRFAKGKSGNPSGRPKRSKKDLSQVAQDVFEQTVSVVVNGKSKKVPAVYAMMMKVLAMGMSGDPRFMKMGFDLYGAFHPANDDTQISSGSSYDLTPEVNEAISKLALLKGAK